MDVTSAVQYSLLDILDFRYFCLGLRHNSLQTRFPAGNHMINCRNCINWVDESLEQIEADHNAHPHIFMGCRIFGFLEQNENLPNCKHYRLSENLFTICSSCRITVPKVCVSLGECANCMDTDLFCLESCKGSENRKFCGHFIRLRTEGMHLIDKDRVYDLFPNQGMPGQEQSSSDSKTLKEKSTRDKKPRSED